jgi:hypothetical protein
MAGGVIKCDVGELAPRQTGLKSSHEAAKALDGLFLGQIPATPKQFLKKINKLTKIG